MEHNPTQVLTFALEKYPEKVEIAPIEDLVMDAARQNAKRPAYVKLAVPDDIVKAIRGNQQSNDLVLLVKVPKATIDRAASPIVLPGEV